MKYVNHKGVASDEVEKRNFTLEESFCVAVFDYSPRKISRQKEKNPRNYRKIVG